MDYSSNEIILYILILEGPSLDKPTMPLIRYYILASFQVVLLMLQAGKGKADSTCSITNLIFLGNYAKHFLWLETEVMSQLSMTGYCFFYLVGLMLVVVIKCVHWLVHVFCIRYVQFFGSIKKQEAK